jgi:hypothetical protein
MNTKGLVLVLLVVFFSATASATRGATPSNTPRQRPSGTNSSQIQSHDDQTEREHGGSTYPIASVGQLEPAPSQTKAPDRNEQIQGETAEFTALLVFVGLLQVGAALLQWCTSRSASRAARDSAEAARLALKANRPFLWVRKVEGENDIPTTAPDLGAEFADPNIVTLTNCSVQNLGKGPAFIIEVKARLKFTPNPLPLPPTFDDCLVVEVLQPVVTESEPTIFPIRGGGVDTQDALKMVDTNAAEKFACYGKIRYRDVFGNTYRATFGFSRQFLRRSAGDAFRWEFVPSPKYNLEQEKEKI